MGPEWRKIKGILDELIRNSMKAGAKILEAKIEEKDDHFEIYIKDNGEGMDDKTLEHVKEALSMPRRCEIEEYYGNLVGHSSGDFGLSMIGMMTDDFYINSKKGKGTEIKIIRKKECR
ncbi:ATP-binding protein [Natranaerofaba carboxydovora]|uniref:ATP-binding protein n=1 Tax=Natranaerofaba carboxydovora TaxID=2742683 RepID=UPI001F1383C2|nr:ATP-binding protein [Natranaerofaba carboxydovora]UMZ74452.1 Histidine kinase-, DNA gyrase B-, and HSP90-like ATPase [Natranaerofaba carboxydovora]